jgi:hypothetical protein
MIDLCSADRKGSTPRKAAIVKKFCKLCQTEHEKKEWRAASTEYLFEQVSPIIIQEAQRQLGLLFGAQGAPSDLITIHIRWGGKFWEMDLAKIDECMHAIKQLLPTDSQDVANIYLATEDPKAVDEFLQAKPDGWNVYYDITVKKNSTHSVVDNDFTRIPCDLLV